MHLVHKDVMSVTKMSEQSLIMGNILKKLKYYESFSPSQQFFHSFYNKTASKTKYWILWNKQKKPPKTPPKKPTTLIAVMSFIAVYQNGLEQ